MLAFAQIILESQRHHVEAFPRFIGLKGSFYWPSLIPVMTYGVRVVISQRVVKISRASKQLCIITAQYKSLSELRW